MFGVVPSKILKKELVGLTLGLYLSGLGLFCFHSGEDPPGSASW